MGKKFQAVLGLQCIELIWILEQPYLFLHGLDSKDSQIQTGNHKQLKCGPFKNSTGGTLLQNEEDFTNIELYQWLEAWENLSHKMILP